MDSQEIIPVDYEHQIQVLKSKNQPLVLRIGGVKTLALWTKNGYKPYVEVAERVRILHQKIRDKEIASYEMLVSEPGEILGIAYWQVRICIKWAASETGSLYVGSNKVQTTGATSGSADDKDCIANAETSALGRALGAAGLGTIDGLASYDEMRQAGYSSNPPRETRTVDEEPSPEIKAIMIQELEQKCTKLYGANKFETVKKRLDITASTADMSMEEIEKIDKALTAREKQVGKTKVAEEAKTDE